MMKKVKIGILSIMAFAISLFALQLFDVSIAKETDYMTKDNQLSFIDVDSKEFRNTMMESFKKELGDDYIEILDKNAKASSTAS